MRRPLVSPSDGFTRPANTMVREWHRLACCAMRNKRTPTDEVRRWDGASRGMPRSSGRRAAWVTISIAPPDECSARSVTRPATPDGPQLGPLAEQASLCRSVTTSITTGRTRGERSRLDQELDDARTVRRLRHHTGRIEFAPRQSARRRCLGGSVARLLATSVDAIGPGPGLSP